MVKGRKQTEIGWIPEDWEVRELGEVGAVRMCKRIFQHQTAEYGEIPFFKIGTFGKEPDAFISRKLFEEFKSKFSYPKVGDILISAAGTIGRTVVYDGEERYYQDSNIVWIDNEENIISNRLLKYVLEIVSYNTEGGTIQRLYNSILRSTKFVCPPLHEQEAIAGALSDADAWIESLEQLIAKKRLIKQGAMQELLTPPSDAKASESWEVKKLGAVTDSFSGGTPNTSVDIYYDGEINFITSGELNQQRIKSTENTITQAGLDNSSAKLVKENSLLIAMYGATAGVVAINKISGAINQAVLAVVPKKNYSVGFLFYFFDHKKEYIIKTYTQGGQPNLSGGILKNIEIPFPPFTEQTRIAAILSDMDAELEALEQQLHKARQIKQGMMQELLTGRVRLV